MSKHTTLRTSLIIASSALVLAATLASEQAEAQRRNSGGIAAGIVGAAIVGGIISDAMNNAAKGLPQQQQRGGGVKKRSAPKDDDEEEKSSESKTRERKDAAANFAKLQEELKAAERARRLERQRNVEMAINDFVSCLELLHDQLRLKQDGRIIDCQAEASGQLASERRSRNVTNVRASQGVNVNQVTAGEIRKAVEDAYATARMGEFERLAGEMWTRDRLMVSIIDRAARQLSPYFRGVGVKGASMDDLRQVFKSSAMAVQARAFETTEIVGVSYSFDRFIHTIYENSDRADENLSTVGADGHYERLVSTAINVVPRGRFISDDRAQVGNKLGMAQQFHYRFRARRAIYDCLSANYLAMVNSGEPRLVPVSPGAAGAQKVRMAQMPGSTHIGLVGNTEVPGAWQRVRSFVRNDCLATVMLIVDQSVRGDLRPITSRFDLAPKIGMAIGGGEIRRTSDTPQRQ